MLMLGQTVSQTVVAGSGGAYGTTGPKATGVNGTASSGNGLGTTKGGSNIGIIAGAAIAVVAGLAIIGGIVYFVMRNARKQRNAQQLPSQPFNSQAPDDFNGKAELAGNPISAAAIPPPSPSPSMMKYGGSTRVNTVSPISTHASAYPPPTQELGGQDKIPPVPQFNSAFPPPSRPELQGRVYGGNATLPPNHVELQGQNMYNNVPQNRPEMYTYNQASQQGTYGQQPHGFATQQQVYQADSRPVQPQRAELQGMGYHSGPVQEYAELDGGYGRSMEPHAR